MSKPLFKRLFLVSIVLLCFIQSINACMYGPPYLTVCETYGFVDAVIIGKILRVETVGFRQTVNIKVIKTFKGQNRKTYVLDQHLSTCDWDFRDKENETLLLYLTRDKKTAKYQAFAQGMGGDPLRESGDLYWLRNLPYSLKRTRVSGSIELYKKDPFDFLNFMPGVKVKIFDEKKSYEVFTDKNGVYQIWDLPKGVYKILPVIPSGYDLHLTLSKGNAKFKEISSDQVDTNDFTIEIQPKTCGGADYVLNKTSQ